MGKILRSKGRKREEIKKKKNMIKMVFTWRDKRMCSQQTIGATDHMRFKGLF